MKLHEYAFTRSIRARWTLQEPEAISVNLFAGEALRPEFLKLNPAAKLPVLVDGDFVLTESAAIVLYLAEKYGKFLPTDAHGRAEVNRWLLFTVTELEQPLWRIAKNEFLYPENQRLAADIPLAGEDFRRMADVSEKHMQGRKFVVGDLCAQSELNQGRRSNGELNQGRHSLTRSFSGRSLTGGVASSMSAPEATTSR